MSRPPHLRLPAWPSGYHGAVGVKWPSDSPEDLDIAVEEEDGRIVFRLAGELDGLNAPHLRAALLEHVEDGCDGVIDLRQLVFIDSSGIGVLVGALKRYEAAGNKLILRSPGPSLRRVLNMTGLAEAFVVEG